LDNLGEMMEHCVFDRDCGLCQNWGFTSNLWLDDKQHMFVFGDDFLTHAKWGWTQIYFTPEMLG
jgi:hypothetical protein